ncbi:MULTISPECIES: alpha/beta fold hydrolase [unclassified Nocardioides]|uniref:alpha/beta fold hydrolase n=1 Tax=unclassified Nocardioides TaxID=2615069 RepID=UPI00361F5844
MSTPVSETPTGYDFAATQRELATEQGVLRYHDVGEGPPLLMLHGSGPGVTGWRNFAGNLPLFARHFRCLVLDFPGFGVSDPTDQHPMLAALPAVSAFLDGLGLDRVDVIGNSMGGIVGARFAMAQPDRVRRLVTVGGLGTQLLSPSPGEGINLLVEFTENPTRERLVQWLHSMVFDKAMVTEELIAERWAQATDPDTLASARRMYGRGVLEAAARAAAASPEPPYWAMLHRITARTLITWGRDDRVSPLDMALVPMRTIPDVELHVFPACGHWAMIEQKAAWESAVLAFLTRTDEAA